MSSDNFRKELKTLEAGEYARLHEDAILSVGYQVGLEVKIDKKTGEVLAVIVFPEGATIMEPLHVYDDETGHYLDRHSPDFERAVDIAAKQYIYSEEVQLGWTPYEEPA